MKSWIDTLTNTDLVCLSRGLLVFLSNHIPDSLYPRRAAIAGGEDGNGFELWRQLFLQYEGGSTLVHLQGVRSFHAFPACKKIENLNARIGQWLQAQSKFASGMPEEHLRDFVHL